MGNAKKSKSALDAAREQFLRDHEDEIRVKAEHLELERKRKSIEEERDAAIAKADKDLSSVEQDLALLVAQLRGEKNFTAKKVTELLGLPLADQKRLIKLTDNNVDDDQDDNAADTAEQYSAVGDDGQSA